MHSLSIPRLGVYIDLGMSGFFLLCTFSYTSPSVTLCRKVGEQIDPGVKPAAIKVSARTTKKKKKRDSKLIR